MTAAILIGLGLLALVGVGPGKQGGDSQEAPPAVQAVHSAHVAPAPSLALSPEASGRLSSSFKGASYSAMPAATDEAAFMRAGRDFDAIADAESDLPEATREALGLGEGSSGSGSSGRGRSGSARRRSVPVPDHAESRSGSSSGLAEVSSVALDTLKSYGVSAKETLGKLAAPVLTIVRRSSWGAEPPKESFVRHSPDRITLHHTEGHAGQSFKDSAKTVQSIQEFHKYTRGWNDIGYHYLIDGTGVSYVGRPENVVGSHTEDQNTGNIGIALQGDYEDHPPSGPTILSFINLATKVALENNMDVDNADFLQDHQIRNGRGHTSCPGTFLHKMLPELRRIIVEHVKKARAAGARTYEGPTRVI